MEYIERKGYCKYILGEGNKFIRTLTEKGYEPLSFLDYGKYRRHKRITDIKSWLPIVISVIAIMLAIANFIYTISSNANQNREIEKRLSALEAGARIKKN